MEDIQQLAREYAVAAGRAIEAKTKRTGEDVAALERHAQEAYERLRRAQGRPLTAELVTG